MTQKRLYSKILDYAKKLKAINLLGGKCQMCGETDFFKLCFHHSAKYEKECKINKLKGSRWSRIEKEIKKCILLCHNCHYEIHQEDFKHTFRIDDKKIYLEYKNVDGCEKCGYNKSLNALHFHHISGKTFEFRFLKENVISLQNLNIEIIDEINKCEILCANCHAICHSDVEFFKNNFKIIEEKSMRLKENVPKISREVVKQMYFIEGKKQIQIVNYFNCSKGAISEIIKELKNIALE